MADADKGMTRPHRRLIQLHRTQEVWEGFIWLPLLLEEYRH